MNVKTLIHNYTYTQLYLYAYKDVQPVLLLLLLLLLLYCPIKVGQYHEYGVNITLYSTP